MDRGIDGVGIDINKHDVGNSKIMDWMKVIKWVLIAFVGLSIAMMITMVAIVLAGYKLMINW